jgi:endonuclease/exonuclease/phosphatase family metal-dependent hydrolase
LSSSFARSAVRARSRAGGFAVLCAAALAIVALPAGAQASAPKAKVMTRNLYLGADLTPGVQANSVQQLVDAAGVILNQVDANKFNVRAKGLASEILKKGPNLVGLQEAALWRDAPCTDNPLPPSATHVRWDFVKLLRNQLNKNAKLYRVVVSEPEFDFQVWANTDGDEATSGPGCPFGSEIEGRLTMRDVILARRGVRTKAAKGGHFDTLLQVNPGGVPTNVTRGWTRVNAKVGNSHWFRFVNTHLEAFDSQGQNHTNQGTDVGKGEIREAQAKELVASGGPATGKLPVVLVGDLNSDDDTVHDGDQLAYNALIAAGLQERSTSNPLGCCLNTNGLITADQGSVSDFDHQVDHILTDTPSKIRLVSSSVTGRQPVNGFWDSDHAGLFSRLTVP